MGAVLCCPCRTIAKLFNPSKSFGTVLCCLPLALFALLCSIALIIWGSWDSYAAVTKDKWPNGDLVMVLVIAILKCIMGLTGLIAVLFRWSPGVSCLILAYKILTASILFTFIVSWIIWIVDMIHNWKPTRSEIQYMVIFTILHVLYLALSWWILSCFASLQKVLAVGGTGWESANWKEIVGDNVVRDDDYA